MKKIALALSILALLLTIVPPTLVLKGSMEVEPMKLTLLVATILWFVVWPIANRESDS